MNMDKYFCRKLIYITAVYMEATTGGSKAVLQVGYPRGRILQLAREVWMNVDAVSLRR